MTATDPTAAARLRAAGADYAAKVRSATVARVDAVLARRLAVSTAVREKLVNEIVDAVEGRL